jgi:hypothetical protein
MSQTQSCKPVVAMTGCGSVETVAGTSRWACTGVGPTKRVTSPIYGEAHIAKHEQLFSELISRMGACSCTVVSVGHMPMSTLLSG